MQQCLNGKVSSSATHSSLPLVAIVQDEPAMLCLSIAKGSHQTLMRHAVCKWLTFSLHWTTGLVDWEDCADKAFEDISARRQGLFGAFLGELMRGKAAVDIALRSRNMKLEI
eukprot:scaffold24107_cov35-Prasinocladus_malaysianus.AAC.1